MDKVVHIIYGGNFSPPTKGHIYGILYISKLMKKLHPNYKVKIYWTPTSRFENDKIVHDRCVSEEQRLRMLELLKEEMEDYISSNIKIKINTVLIDSEMKLNILDTINLTSRKYNFDNNDKIYVLYSENVLRSIIENKRREPHAYQLLNEYPILFYPTSVQEIGNKSEIISGLVEKAKRHLGIDVAAFHMIDQELPVEEASKARLAARAGSKKQLLEYVPTSIADYIIKNKIYKSSACFLSPSANNNIKKSRGGRRQRIKSRTRKNYRR